MSDTKKILDIKEEKYTDEDIDDILLKSNYSACKIYLKELTDCRKLTQEEEIALSDKIKAGDENAKEELIIAGLKLVVSIAYDTMRKNQYKDDIMDLIQDGNIGLITAAESYDSTKGYRFSTYAAKCIKSAIIREHMNKARLIHMPEYLAPTVGKINEYTRKYYKENGAYPTPDMIIKELNISEELLKSLNHLRTPFSLNQLAREDNQETESEAIDFLEDGTNMEESIIEKIYTSELKKYILETPILKESQRQVLIYRYGLIDGKIRTTTEIASLLGVTHQRVNQIEKAALIKIRSSQFVQTINEAETNTPIKKTNDKSLTRTKHQK